MFYYSHHSLSNTYKQNLHKKKKTIPEIIGFQANLLPSVDLKHKYNLYTPHCADTYIHGEK